MVFLARQLLGPAVAVVVLTTAPRTLQADLFVADWFLYTSTSDPADGNHQDAFILSIQNPLQVSTTAAIGPSYSTAVYDLGWLVDDAHFDITIDHRLEQLDGDTTTGGSIYLTPSVDSYISAEGRFQYAWPNDAIGAADLVILAFNEDSGDQPIQDSASGGNFGLNPPFGTLEVSDTGLLHAGVTYELYYFARIIHFEPTPPGTYGWGSGEFHFSIVPVPESATLSLLILPAILARHRRRLFRGVGPSSSPSTLFQANAPCTHPTD